MTLTTFTIAPPKKGVNPPIVNAPGLGQHFRVPTKSSDQVIDGTFDSAVLIDEAAKGTVLHKYHVTQGASIGDGPGYGRHGFYVKARNVSLWDVWVQTDPNAIQCNSCFSVRDSGFCVTRFHADGKFISTIYDDLLIGGNIMFRYGKGNAFKDDTANWIDTAVGMTIWYEYCDFNGNGMFAKCSDRFIGALVIRHCTWNGKDVTKGMIGADPKLVTVM